jgi:hypothetical protein
MGLQDDVRMAFSEYEQKLITKDQAKQYILQRAKKYNHKLNVDNYNLGKCCMLFLEHPPESKEYQEAKDFFESMVAPLTDDEKVQKNINHQMNLFKAKREDSKIEMMKKELEDYKTRNKKATLRFTGDTFDHFIKKCAKQLEKNPREVAIEFENGVNEFRLHLIGVGDENQN